jgi:hypothetical protein
MRLSRSFRRMLPMLFVLAGAAAAGAQDVRRAGADMDVGGDRRAGADMRSPAERSEAGDVQAAAGAQGPQALPRGFRGIELGMELATVKELLRQDPLFAYRGDPDVSFLPVARQTLIECPGDSFLKRAYFQFEEDRLFVLILDLDPQRVDWFSVYSTLSGKYGDAQRISPSDAVWQSVEVRLSLERPLTVKYIDLAVFERLQREGRAGEKLKDLSRQQFLDQF